MPVHLLADFITFAPVHGEAPIAASRTPPLS
jgi:hypothetical protein